MPAKYGVIIHKGKDGQHYVRVKAGNGQIVLQSEGYTRRTAAKHLANRLTTGAIFHEENP